MMPIQLFLHRVWLHFIGLALLMLALPVQAGSISFNLALNNNRLTLTNQGNSTAFHPLVYRLLADGRWSPLQALPGKPTPVEMTPNMQIDFAWPDNDPAEALTPLASLRPVMVRFFDQAGAAFGQISFFNQPLQASADEMVRAGYVDGRMKILPPKNEAIRATWLIWPQEDGIARLTTPVEPAHQQPPARRIEWQPGMDAQQFNLGKGMPVSFLLHETNAGFRLQVVADGRVQGRQQRAAWLDAAPRFYFAARLILAAALALLAWQWVGAWRSRRIQST